MVRPRVFTPVVFLVLGLLVGPTSSTAQDRTPEADRKALHEVLAEGSTWMLSVNELRAPLVLRDVEGRRSAEGAIALTADVAWRGRTGRLRARSDPKSPARRVNLTLETPEGATFSCSGLVAEGDAMMAGTCRRDGTSGAWFALLEGGPEGPAAGRDTAVTRARDEAIRRRDRDRRVDVSDRIRVPADSISEVRDHRAEAAERKVRDHRGEERVSAGPRDPPDLDSFLGDLDGKYQESGKFDQVGSLAFPTRPASNSDLSRWLEALAGGLLNVLEGVYPRADVDRFLSAEGDECRTGGIYCKLAFRQKAIGHVLEAPP